MEGAVEIKMNEGGWCDRYCILSFRFLSFFEVEDENENHLNILMEKIELSDIKKLTLEANNIVNFFIKIVKASETIFIQSPLLNTWFKTIDYFCFEFSYPEKSRNVNDFNFSQSFYDELSECALSFEASLHQFRSFDKQEGNNSLEEHQPEATIPRTDSTKAITQLTDVKRNIMIKSTKDEKDLQTVLESINEQARTVTDFQIIDIFKNLQLITILIMLASLSIRVSKAIHESKEHSNIYCWLSILAFCINLIAVSIPGCLDRIFKDGGQLQPWSSMVENRSWTPSLWVVIFGLEFLIAFYVLFFGLSSKILIRSVKYWLAGNWFQGLWCFSIRDEFKNSLSLFVPFCCLVVAGLSFALLHFEITRQKDVNSSQSIALLLLLRFPVAVHCAWLCCSVLLNLKSWVALSKVTTTYLIALTNFTIYFAAFFVGGFC